MLIGTSTVMLFSTLVVMAPPPAMAMAIAVRDLDAWVPPEPPGKRAHGVSGLLPMDRDELGPRHELRRLSTSVASREAFPRRLRTNAAWSSHRTTAAVTVLRAHAAGAASTTRAARVGTANRGGSSRRSNELAAGSAGRLPVDLLPHRLVVMERARRAPPSRPHSPRAGSRDDCRRGLSAVTSR